MAALRFFVNDKRVSTAVPLNDGTILQVYPSKKKFVNENAWRLSWESSSAAKPSIRVEQEEDTVRNVKRDWICPACGLGPGNDHRMCICTAYNYSVERWEIACGIRKASSAPAPTPSPSPTNPPLSLAPSPAGVQIPMTASVNVKDWQYSSVKGHVCPAGKYYIGDLCYVLGNAVYDKVYGGHGYGDGLYVNKKTNEFFFVGATAYGDGCYIGSDGKEFGVDAGIIGICPASCMRKDDGGGHMYTFTEPVECKFKGGFFDFISGYNSLTIDTSGIDEDADTDNED